MKAIIIIVIIIIIFIGSFLLNSKTKKPMNCEEEVNSCQGCSNLNCQKKKEVTDEGSKLY